MGQITLQTVQTNDQTLQLIQANVAKALAAIQGVPFGGGSFIQVATGNQTAINAQTGLPQQLKLTAGQPNVLPHTLGYAPRYVLPLAPNVQSNIWVTAVTPATVTLWCSSNCTLSVWVS